MNYRKEQKQFRYTGVNLNADVDAIPDGQLGIATNIRPTQQGSLATRPAIAPFLNPSGVPVHSLKTFSANGVASRFSGAGSVLFQNNANVDGGYSGNPLSFASYQPQQAVQPFLYVADSLRYSKLSADGTRFNVGIAPPPGPCNANLIKPLYIDVNDLSGGFTAGGTAGTPSYPSRVPGGTTTTVVLYDVGNTGWACVAFSSTANSWLTKGPRVNINDTGAYISDLIPAAANTPTIIAAIQYDSGTNGPCCIALASSTAAIARDGLVQLGTEWVRVLSVAVGEDNNVSFRCVTIGTYTAGTAVSFAESARIWFDGTHPVGEAVADTVLASAVTVGQGTLTYTNLATEDLSQINGRPMTPEDWMHVSFLFDAPSNILDIRVLLDVDNTANDFAHNFYYADVTASVLQQASGGAAAVVLAGDPALQATQTAAQLQLLQAQASELAAQGNTYGAQALQNSIQQLQAQVNSQLVTGTAQWSEIFIPYSSLVRVGNDQTVNLDNVKAVQIQISCIDTVNVKIDSWWIGGTYGPNAPQSINPENPIQYTFRYRSTITGAQSTWAPLTRGGIFPERQGIGITAVPFSQDAQVDTIDFARVGGSVNGTPEYLSSIPNNTAGGFGSYIDNFADAELGDQIAPGDNQPWPVQQGPIIGTCSVVGTTVYATSVTIPTNLCEGTICLINGQATVIRGLPGPNQFQVEDNIDFATGATLQIWSPTTFGNPLPYLAGPYDESFFAAGDPLNPGRIYWSNRTNPDTAATSNFQDLTSSAEPILAVGIYNGYVVVATGEQWFIGATTNNPVNPYSFTTTQVGQGLLSPWSFTIGPAIFFWSRNGICLTDLGPAKNITAADLYPYMPHEGLVGAAVNGYAAPAINVPQRLSYCKNGWLYFDFVDTSSNLRTLAFDTTKPGWWFDCYTPAVTLHYQDEAEGSALILCGCSDGTIQQFSKNATDTGGVINCQARLGAQEYGDMRTLKQAIDLCVEICGTITFSLFANSWQSLIFTQNVPGAMSGFPVVLPISVQYDPSQLWLDFALDLTWTGAQEAIQFDLGYLQNPMLAPNFVANPTMLQFDGYGHVREIILNTIARAPLLNPSIVINAEFPGTMTIPVFIPAGPYRQYISLPPNKGMLYEISIQGNVAEGNGLNFGLFACDLHVKGWREKEYRLAAPFTE